MFLLKYYKTCLSFFIIIIFCFIPGNTANKITFFNFPYFDKLVHFVMYFIFSVALFLDLKNNTSIQKKYLFFIILFSSFLFGAFTELIQNFFISNRSGDWFDLLADTTGSLCFLLFILLKNKQKSRNYKN